MCGIQLKDRKRSEDLMLILVLNATIDQLAMANSVHCYGHVLKKVDCHVLRRALDSEVESKWKKKRPKKGCESIKVGLSREMHFANQSR